MLGVLRRNPLATAIALLLHMALAVLIFFGNKPTNFSDRVHKGTRIIRARVVIGSKKNKSSTPSPKAAKAKAKAKAPTTVTNDDGPVPSEKIQPPQNNKTIVAHKAVDMKPKEPQLKPTMAPVESAPPTEKKLEQESTKFAADKQLEQVAVARIAAEKNLAQNIAINLALEQRQREIATKITAEQQQRVIAAELAAEQQQREIAAKLAVEQQQQEAVARFAAEQQQREIAARLAAEQQQREIAARLAVEQQQREIEARLAAEQQQRVKAAKLLAQNRSQQKTNSSSTVDQNILSTTSTNARQNNKPDSQEVEYLQTALEHEQTAMRKEELRIAHRKIKSVIRNTWRIPAHSKHLRCTIRVRISKEGDVLDQQIIVSSGNRAFDLSVERAVERASPLPIPDDPNLFDENLELVFDPTQD